MPQPILYPVLTLLLLQKPRHLKLLHLKRDVESWEDIIEDTPVQKGSPEERKDSPSTTNRPTETAGESTNAAAETGSSQDRSRQETVDDSDKTTPTNANSTNTSHAPVTKTPKHKDDNPAPAKNTKNVVPPPKTSNEKENINIVFIGHVGMLCECVYLYIVLSMCDLNFNTFVMCLYVY